MALGLICACGRHLMAQFRLLPIDKWKIDATKIGSPRRSLLLEKAPWCKTIRKADYGAEYGRILCVPKIRFG